MKGSKEEFIPWRINAINARTRQVTLSVSKYTMNREENNIVAVDKKTDNTSLFSFEIV